MSKKTIIYLLIGLVILIIGGGLYYLLKDDTEEPEQTETTQTVEEEVADGVPQDVDAEEVTNLVTVENYIGRGSGTATRRMKDGEFIHVVTAEIENPSVGKFYEGWLVKDGGFFSTGRMTKSDGIYKLTYKSSEDKSSYNEVVVTLETEAEGLDGMPEEHVLEGSF